MYGTILTPYMFSKWSADKDGIWEGQVIRGKDGTVQHILVGFRVALGHEGRYRRRQNKDLKQISEQYMFHCERRLNT